MWAEFAWSEIWLPSWCGPSFLWAEFVMGRVCYGPRCPGILERYLSATMRFFLFVDIRSSFPLMASRVAEILTGPLKDLWTFRDLDFSRVVLSRPMIGPFATLYFSHLFDPSRFATSVIFAVCCQLTDYDKSVLF